MLSIKPNQALQRTWQSRAAELPRYCFQSVISNSSLWFSILTCRCTPHSTAKSALVYNKEPFRRDKVSAEPSTGSYCSQRNFGKAGSFYGNHFTAIILDNPLLVFCVRDSLIRGRLSEGPGRGVWKEFIFSQSALRAPGEPPASCPAPAK